MAMAMQMMKRSMSRMLKQSIVDLCRSSLGSDGYMEIDGIVCITIGEEETEEIVVKVHEILGDEDDLPLNIRKPPTPQPPPPRNTLPANMRGNIRMHPQGMPPHSSQSMGNPQQANKAIYAQGKGNQGPPMMMPSGPGGRPHPQSEMFKRQQSGPGKPRQQPAENKKPQPPPVDDSIIKIEIESDEEPEETEPVKPSKPAVMCSVCDMGLASVAALRIHMTDLHRALPCEICWMPFQTKADLNNHMKTHNKGGRQERPTPSPKNERPEKKDGVYERFKCGVCGNTSDAHKLMVDHLRTAHEFQGCYTCMLCREHFPNKPTFSIHRKLSHSDALDFICKTCGVGLKQLEVENHQKECMQTTETPEKKQGKKNKLDSGETGTPAAKRQCPTPGQSSTLANKPGKKQAQQNPNSHDKNGFECQICCLLLDSFKAYGTHVKNVHQRHVCPICVGTFQTSRAVQQHTSRHTTSLPFTCDKCGLGSHTEDEFKRHNIVSHNTHPAIFTCPQCNILIGSKNEFLTHMAEVHKVDYLWDEELEKYVVLGMEGEEEEGYEDEEGEFLDEDGQYGNHGQYGSADRQHFQDGNYDLDDEEDYDDEGMDPGDLVTCNICEIVVSSLEALKEHISKVHHAVVCEICWRPFLSQPELDNHRKTAHGEVSSTTSGGQTPANSGANNQKEATPKAQSTSPATSTATSSSMSPAAKRQPATSTVVSSGPINKSPTNLKCGVCGAATEGRKGMVDHLKTAHEYLGCFTCMLCGEFFPNKPTFTIHRKLSHSEARETTCHSCGVGLYDHEYDGHIAECEGSGIDIKEAEWEGKKETEDKKEKKERKEKRDKK